MAADTRQALRLRRRLRRGHTGDADRHSQERERQHCTRSEMESLRHH
jgi:hypothetical protein